MEIGMVFVVGAGTMGNGIAQVCAQKGISIVLNDISQDALDKAVKNINWSVSKFVDKGRLSESVETIMGRIQTSTGLDEARNADLVIEAVFEDLKVKQEIVKKLDEVVGDKTILASNTSAIPITEIASASTRSENFIGLHFFNPVPMMAAVEVIRGITTTDEAFQYGADFVRYIGKEPILVNRDIAGALICSPIWRRIGWWSRAWPLPRISTKACAWPLAVRWVLLRPQTWLAWRFSSWPIRAPMKRKKILAFTRPPS